MPYGQELTNPFTDSEVMKFTSHERDRDPTGFGNDVDYMHARYYLHRTGRFLSPDPLLGTPDRPQSWNRYAYVMGSPMNFIDEYGLEMSCKNNQGENDRIHCAEKLTVTAKAPPDFTSPVDPGLPSRQRRPRAMRRLLRGDAWRGGNPGAGGGVGDGGPMERRVVLVWKPSFAPEEWTQDI